MKFYSLIFKIELLINLHNNKIMQFFQLVHLFWIFCSITLSNSNEILKFVFEFTRHGARQPLYNIEFFKINSTE